MLITRTSMFTGKVHSREINVTRDQLERYESGALIQNAMPNVPKEEREFIMTGVTPEEWTAAFKDAE